MNHFGTINAEYLPVCRIEEQHLLFCGPFVHTGWFAAARLSLSLTPLENRYSREISR